MWPTPTPLPPSGATPAFDLGFEGTDLAEGIVQAWQQMDQWNVVDFMMIPLIIFLVLGGLWSIINHWRKLKDD